MDNMMDLTTTPTHRTDDDAEFVLRTPEYEAATQRFLSEAIHVLMRAKDPIFAQIRRHSAEHVPDTQVPLQDGRVIENPSTLITAEVVINVREIVKGNLESVYASLDQAADQMLGTLMTGLFQHISEVSDAVGNTVSADGRELSWDLILDLLEKVEMTFNESGEPSNLSIVAGPEMVARLRALPPLTPEQLRRHEAIISRKREEWRAQRRRRTLPRHRD